MDDKPTSIHLQDVWEQYRIKFVREKRVFWEHIWALQGINLEVEKGECVGIIGENGLLAKDKSQFIGGMERLINDRQLCSQIGENALQTVKDNYSLSVLGKRLYEGLAEFC